MTTIQHRLRHGYPSKERIEAADHIDALEAQVAALTKDAERLDWLDKNIFNRENLNFRGDLNPNYNMWVTFAPTGVQGSARAIIDAAIAAQKEQI